MENWVDGRKVLDMQWHRRKYLPNYEVPSTHPFVEESKKKLVSYSFGVILRESCWNEDMLQDEGIYLTYEPNAWTKLVL